MITHIIRHPKVNPIKTFFSRNLRIFVVIFATGKPFQFSLMFMGKARGLPQGRVPERCFTWVGSGLTRKFQTRLERLARDKNSSLLQKSVNYGCKKFYRIGPWLKKVRRKFVSQFFIPAQHKCNDEAGKSYRRGRYSTVDPLELTI